MPKHHQKRVKTKTDESSLNPKITKWLTVSPKKPTSQNTEASYERLNKKHVISDNLDTTNRDIQPSPNDQLKQEIDPKTPSKGNTKITENCDSKSSKINKSRQEYEKMMKHDDSELEPVNQKRKRKCYKSKLSNKDDETSKSLDGQKVTECGKAITTKDNTRDKTTSGCDSSQKRRKCPKVLDDYVYNNKITRWLIVSPKKNHLDNRLHTETEIDGKIKIKKHSSEVMNKTSNREDKNLKEKKKRRIEESEIKSCSKSLKLSRRTSKNKLIKKKSNEAEDKKCKNKKDNLIRKNMKLSIKKTKQDKIEQQLEANKKQPKKISINSTDKSNKKDINAAEETKNNISITKNEDQNNIKKRKRKIHTNKRKLNQKITSDDTKGTLKYFLNRNKGAKAENNKHIRNCYERYGINLPSFSEIMKARENLDDYNEKVNKAIDFIRQVKLSKGIDKSNISKDNCAILGCDFLTPPEIEEYFIKFLPYLTRIIEGSEYNWRHEKFFNSRSSNINKLNYNTSMVTFTHEQKDQLADLCTEHFEEYPISNHNKYYFNVLLPELCLRIFMDVHKMNHDDALDYLEKRPVEDVC